jgi:hypothetical protein
MPQSVSFAQLRAVLAAAKGNDARTFVGTRQSRQGNIVVSVNFSYETSESTEVGQRGGKPIATGKTGKKRGRDANEEVVQPNAGE